MDGYAQLFGSRLVVVTFDEELQQVNLSDFNHPLHGQFGSRRCGVDADFAKFDFGNQGITERV